MTDSTTEFPGHLDQRLQSPGSTQRIRPAATLVPIRTGVDGVEVLMIRRAETMRFLPGYIAFPGGAVNAVDAQLSTRWSIGVPQASMAPDDAVFAAAALRETAEEIGWVCALAGPQGSQPDHELTPSEQERLWQDENAIIRWLHDNDGRLDISRLRFVGRWVTPPTQPARFDTRFFVYEAAGLGEPRVNRAELTWAGWCSARSMLTAIEDGRAHAVPPTIAMLRALAGATRTAAVMTTMHVPGPAPQP